METAESMAVRGHHYIGVMKTATSQFPKKFLVEKMKGWPRGSHLLLETATEKGANLCALGYKYNNKKMMMFVFTKGAGHTENGTLYTTEWKDENGNLSRRCVVQPHVYAKYYARCNTIDIHNQGRQHDLRLEDHWVVQCGWFRLVTTLVGMTVTDL